MYHDVDPADVALTNLDDEAGRIQVTPVGPLTTTEAGGIATFSLVLSAPPTSDVFIPMSSSNTGEGVVSPAAILFTPANWDLPVQVTDHGRRRRGSRRYGIVLGNYRARDESDPIFNGVDPADVAVRNLDDEVAPVEPAPTTPPPAPAPTPPAPSVPPTPNPAPSTPEPVAPISGPAPNVEPNPAGSGTTSAAAPSPAAAQGVPQSGAGGPAGYGAVGYGVPVGGPAVVAPAGAGGTSYAMPQSSVGVPVAGSSPTYAGLPTSSGAREELVGKSAKGALPIVRSRGAARVTPEDTPLAFSKAAGMGISVLDPDGLPHALVVTLVARHGRVSLAQANGVRFEERRSGAPAELTFSGHLDDINATLDTLTFVPDRDYAGPSGAVCVEVGHEIRPAGLPSPCSLGRRNPLDRRIRGR